MIMSRRDLAINSRASKGSCRTSRSSLPGRNRPCLWRTVIFVPFQHPVAGLCQMAPYRSDRRLVSSSSSNPFIQLVHVPLRMAFAVNCHAVACFDKRPFQVAIHITSQLTKTYLASTGPHPWHHTRVGSKLSRAAKPSYHSYFIEDYHCKDQPNPRQRHQKLYLFVGKEHLFHSLFKQRNLSLRAVQLLKHPLSRVASMLRQRLYQLLKFLPPLLVERITAPLYLKPILGYRRMDAVL